MSTLEKASVECPHCGAQNTFTYWSSVNVTVHPELKAQLLDGRLVRLQCASCGRRTTVQFDILYHDMNRHVAVWLRHAKGDRIINEIDPRLSKLWYGLMGDNRITRTVPAFERLVEKIQIFDYGLDDFTVEIYKLVVRLREGIDFACPMVFHSVSRSFFGGPMLVLKVPAGDRSVKKPYPLREALADVAPFLERLAATHPPPIEEWAQVDAQYVFGRLEAAGLLPKPAVTPQPGGSAAPPDTAAAAAAEQRRNSEAAKKNAEAYLVAALSDFRGHKNTCNSCRSWKEVFRVKQQLECPDGQLRYQAVIDWALLYLFATIYTNKPEGMECAFRTPLADAIDAAETRLRCTVKCRHNHPFRVPQHLGNLHCTCPQCGDTFDWEPQIPLPGSWNQVMEALAIGTEIADSVKEEP